MQEKNATLTVSMESLNCGSIPMLVYRPKYLNREKWPTVIFYHGWSSNKDSQHMRAHILAAHGYQAIVPDAAHHGERGTLDYDAPKVTEEYLWECVKTSMDEFPELAEFAITELDADPKNIATMGHSMGGITAAAIFTHQAMVKTAIPMNGSLNWDELLFKIEREGNYPEIMKEKKAEILDLDPISNVEKLVDRPLLMIHGEDDDVVPTEPDLKFYDKAKASYSEEEQSSIQISVHPGTAHVVTTNMMEEAMDWLAVQLN